MDFATADLYDANESRVRVLELPLLRFGARARFAGPISTVRCFEDNSRVREAVGEPGEGRVLVVDGGASLRFALLGDRLAQLAVDQGWVGVVVRGAIRDAAVIADIPIGVAALGTCPARSRKLGQGERDVEISFGQARFSPGAWLYCDEDGILVADGPIHSP